MSEGEEQRGGERALGSLVAPGLFCLAAVVVPFVWPELLPFTDAALFTDAQGRYAVYEVSDEQGTRFHPGHFGLALAYGGLRGGSVRFPRRPPGAVAALPSENLWGEVLDEQSVRRIVGRKMRENGWRGPFIVEQYEVGAVDEARAGVVAMRRWVIDGRDEVSP